MAEGTTPITNGVMLRDYQQKLVEIARNQNTIIFLPTGSGKTFIALEVIKLKSNELKRPYDCGGKRTFFLVHTKPLVNQQALEIERRTDLTVGRYSGELNTDTWNPMKWKNELQKHQVMVMTHKILEIMLQQNCISLSNINLIIFDECHYAKNDHPYREIMKKFKNVRKQDQPLIIGLSATLLNGNLESKNKRTKKIELTDEELMEKVKEAVNDLEITFQGKIATSGDYTNVLRFSTCPIEYEIVCESEKFHHDCIEFLSNIYGEEGTYLKLATFPSDMDVRAAQGPLGCDPMKKNNSLNDRVTNMLEDAKALLQLLGIYGGCEAALYHLTETVKLQRNHPDQIETALLSHVILTLNKVRRLLLKKLPNENRMTFVDVLKNSSSKVVQLLNILPMEHEELRRDNKKLCCIVFVERRTTAIVLSNILKTLKRLNPEFDFISTECVIGGEGTHTIETQEHNMERIKNARVLEEFRKGELNVLVATNIVEEGVDLPKCNLVIYFDKPTNYRSYVQSKGRARDRSSKYYILVEEDDSDAFATKLQKYRKMELFLRELLIGRTDQRQIPDEETVHHKLYRREIQPFYAKGPNGPHVTDESAISCVERYCQMLPRKRNSLNTPFVWMKVLDNAKIAAVLRLPQMCPLRENIEGLPMPNIKLAKRSAFMEAVKKLHGMGELTDELTPRKRNEPLLEL